MVKFKLVEENGKFITYWYYPEADEDNGHGVIIIDKEQETIDIAELAPDDFSHEVSIKEQNLMRDSVNEMRKEDGMPELTEEEWPSAKGPFTSTFYADHAVTKICEAYDTGEVLQEGISQWY